MNSKMHKQMLASMLALGLSGVQRDEYIEQEKDWRKQSLIEQAELARKAKMKSQGMNEYYYGDNVIIARSQKNADKKARKKGYL